MKKLTTISHDTHETAVKLKSDAIIQQNISKYFRGSNKVKWHYTCAIPVVYNKRPLPSIHSGDYHAIQILQNLFGTDHLILHEVTSKDNTSFNDRNIIYLCSPQTNGSLQLIAPAVKITGKTKPTKEPTFDGIPLPCWFADYTEINEPQNTKTKRIWIKDGNRSLLSESEKAYQEAHLLPDGEPYPDKLPQTDFGIFLNLSTHGHRRIVIAGIHQYGTWICSEFFQKLLRNESKNSQTKDLLKKNTIAVIWGTFDPNKLQVTDCDISQHLAWSLEKGKWVLLDNPSKNHLSKPDDQSMKRLTLLRSTECPEQQT